ncbi:MAG TPA: response regulator [Acidobacteriaceae bacterium]
MSIPQTSTRLKLFLLVQILAWTGITALFIYRFSQGKSTLLHTIFFLLFAIASASGNILVLRRKIKYPLVTVPPAADAHVVPPESILTAEAQLVVAADLHGKVSYLNPAATRLLGYSAGTELSFFSLFQEKELERVGRNRWLTLGAVNVPPGPEDMGPLRYFIDYAASMAPSVSHETEIQFRREDGESLSALAVFTVLRDPIGEICGILCVATDHAMRHRGSNERRGSLKRGPSILNSIADGIFRTDPEGRLLLVNLAAARMLAVDEADFLGRPLHEVVHEFRQDGQQCGDECLIRRCVTSSTGLSGQDTFFRRDASSFPVEFEAMPLIDDGRLTGMVISFRDISQRHALEHMKDEFISTVSHELRTPLTSIRGALGLLSSGILGSMNEKASHLLRIAVSNTDRLVRLINDILDLERMESGRAPLHFRSCNLADLVSQAVETMTPMADTAGVRLESTIAPLTLDADSDRIQQVLTNLLSNAIKFSPQDAAVHITAQASQTTGMVTLRVTDAGRGIPLEKLEAVFDRFQQVESADARQKGGTGLGLAICRTIVQQHAGTIWAEPNATAGVTFAIQLPRTHTVATNNAPKIPIHQAAGSATILVCDDDPGIRTIVAEQLRLQGYTVVEADRGEQAISMAEELPIDGILLDLYMPGLSGWETLNRLKRNPLTAGIPVVVLSVLSPSERPQLANDADGWVQKPFNESLLLSELGRVLHGADGPTNILLVEDDHDLANILIASFESAGVHISHASTRQEAIAICRSQQPDLLILDLSLPDGDGFGIIDWLRQHPQMRTLPVVVYSGHEVSESEMSQLRLGPTQFLTKAKVLPKDVEALVLTMVRQSRVPSSISTEKV